MNLKYGLDVMLNIKVTLLNLTKLEIKLEVEGRAEPAPYISLLGWRAPLTLPPLVDTISLKDEDIVRSLAKVKASNDSDI